MLSALFRHVALCLATGAASLSLNAAPPVHEGPEMDPRAMLVPMENLKYPFGPDPINVLPYEYERQLDIYGAKHSNPTARPLLELGRELYGPGTFGPGIKLFGEKNPMSPQFLVYGDFRVAAAWNKNGDQEKGVIASKLNLDFDLKLTATERIHMFTTFLDRDGQVTRAELFGDPILKNRAIIDWEPDALFFEGDLARIISGFSNQDNRFDIPFTVGLIPLLFQNGVWMQDAINGFAFTIPARNSPHLQITNMDVTFFAGFDKVTTAAIPNDHQANVFGVNTFIEANSGYYEIGYGYVQGRRDSSDLSYHNFTASFTRRYFDLISNSIRVIWNFGQNPGEENVRDAFGQLVHDAGGQRVTAEKQTTADGLLILFENSLISPKPLTLVPYFNAWVGFNKPQSLARAGAAGGVLVNTGLNFETDQMTGFPKLDDTGHNTYGGALGLEYLFDFEQQIVVEFAALNVFGNPDDRTAIGHQYGVGVRYQRNLSNAWIFRADGIVAARDKEEDLMGFRIELRRKF